MGIDGINKPGAPAPPPGVDGAGSPGFKERLEGERAEPTNQLSHIEAPSALEQLDAGTLSIEEYLDLQVNQAVGHLQGSLPPEQLDFVRESLRSQLQEDPVLIELVRRTTGKAPR